MIITNYINIYDIGFSISLLLIIFYFIITIIKDTGGTGGSRVWDAAHLLGQWIFLNGKLFHNKSVIELGAGLGLPGLSAASLPDATATVALTDVVTEVLDNLKLNVQANENIITAKNVEVLRVDWFDENESLGRYDIILIADVIYSPGIVDPLIATIERICASEIYVCMPTARFGAAEFLNKMKEKGFTRKTIQISTKIFHLCGKKSNETLETYIYHFIAAAPRNIIAAAPRKQTFPNYFIAIRLDSNDLKSKVDAFQQQRIIGKFLNTRTSSCKMHLTYFVMRLDGIEDIEQAKEVFMGCDLDMNVTSDLLLGDVSFFSNTVIKIEIMKDEIYKKLDEIGKKLHDKFTEHGFIKKGKWSWEPHATIAKISADRRNLKQKYNADIIEGEEKAFESLPIRLTTIDILQMNDVDEDGYYKRIATKEFYTV